MVRVASTNDVFSAVAEPVRRGILDALAVGERPVNDLVSALRLSQPQVSKHLAVLKETGLVDVRRSGRHRFYRLNAAALRPVHEWTARFERLWDDQLAGIKARAERAARDRVSDGRGALPEPAATTVRAPKRRRGKDAPPPKNH